MRTGRAVMIVLAVASALPAGDRTERVSVASNGLESDGFSWDAALSADGRFVAFASDAYNLVRADRHGTDVFIHDRRRHSTRRASFAWPGRGAESDCQEPALSGNGRVVAFTCLGPEDPKTYTRRYRVYVRDMRTRKVAAVAVGAHGRAENRESVQPSISQNGRFVAFASPSTNLIEADANRRWDVFVRDLKKRRTTRVSVSSAGQAGSRGSYSPSISANGRFVVFTSRASNLVPGDNRSTTDVFIHDRRSGTTERVSTSATGGNADGDSANPAIAAGGRSIAFQSRARNLTTPAPGRNSNVFLHDRRTGLTQELPAPLGAADPEPEDAPAISRNGRWTVYVHAFRSDVDMMRFDHVLEYDAKTAAVRTLSTNWRGERVTARQPAISADGRFAAFYAGDDLIRADLNDTVDVFVRGPLR